MTDSHRIIKICGNRTVQDALAAQQAGADFIGVVVEVKNSPRSISVPQAIQIRTALTAPLVAVTVNCGIEDLLRLADELQPSALQLHGDESPDDVAAVSSQAACEVWKAVHIEAARDDSAALTLPDLRAYQDAGVTKFVVDAIVRTPTGTVYGGTGKTVDWTAAREVITHAHVPCLLAGGITPGNVHEAIATVRPAGVDVATGVEQSPGKKDLEKMNQLVAIVRSESIAT